MQSIDNVLKLRKGLKPDDPNPDIFDILWAKKLSGAAKEYTITGNPLSFLAKKAQTAKSTKVTLEPVQAGSGDPSPTNIRPISGRSSVEIKGCGKNQFDKDDSDNILKLYIGTGTSVLVNVSTNRSVCMKCKPNMTYTISKKVSERFLVGYVTEVPADGVQCYGVVRDDTATSLTITTGDDALYIVAYISGSNESTASKFNAILNTVQIEFSSKATAYEPYAESNDVTITFGETVYGGTLDVETGELVVDKKLITIKDYDFTYTSASGGVFRTDFDDIKNLATDIISSALQTTTLGIANMPEYSVRGGSGSNRQRVFIKMPDDITTRTSLNNAIGDETICYPLATPRTIQLTPEQIQILKGQNTIWIEDAGATIALTYKN